MTSLFSRAVDFVARHVGKGAMASHLREAARRLDATATPDAATRALFASQAVALRDRADVLDPPVCACVVCGEALSMAMTKTHACSPEAMAAWHARQLDAVDAELDS